MSEKDELAATSSGTGSEHANGEQKPLAGRGEMSPDSVAENAEDPNFAGLSAQLQGLYQGLLDEPIPDRFTQLLKELESKESETK